MISEKHTYTRFTYDNHRLIYNTPNEMCLWRVKTLLTKEPCTIDWLNTLTEDDLLWDVGANIGLYTIFAAIVRRARVVAFEPESQNFASLVRAVYANKASNVTCYPIAISDFTGLDCISISSFETGHSGHNVGEVTKAHQGIYVTTVDQLCHSNLELPTHIKIDVDGFDHRVIKGALNTLPSIKSILIELNTASLQQMAVVEIMEQHGFFYDPKQVEATARPRGSSFEHFREFIFRRY